MREVTSETAGDPAAEGVAQECEPAWHAPREGGGGEDEEELRGVEAEVVGEGGGGVGVAAAEEVLGGVLVGCAVG
jgi:hypothetical protein